MSLFTLSSRLTRASTLGNVVTNRPRGLADHARSREFLSPAIAKNRIKNPGRGGRNLRNRYSALERSLRGKEALTRGRNDQQQIITTSTPATSLAVNLRSSQAAPTFRGFVIPTEPTAPESDECCMSACAVCVYDLYEESLDAYKEAVEDLRKTLTSHNIPEHEWPTEIQTKKRSGGGAQPERRATVIMSAFEEMERRLKEKHARREAEIPSN